VYHWSYYQDNNDLFLDNKSKTVIKKHRGIDLKEIDNLFNRLKEIHFPFFFTEGLESIYFTYLKRGLEGDYDWDGNIHIAFNKKYDAAATIIQILTENHLNFLQWHLKASI